MAQSPKRGAAGKQIGAAGGRRDFAALKRRRLRAATMFAAGKRQVEVADALGVSRPTVSGWYRLWTEGGRAALVGAGRAGRRPRLDDGELARVEAALLRGPRAHGYTTDLWTLARVADVIEATTGVRYGQTQTWELLRGRLGWSRQRPARRAVERDDDSVVRWVKEQWPRIKDGPGGAGRGSSSKTKVGSRSSRR